MGPLLRAPGSVRFLLVVIDYFTKWVEAEPLTTITGTQVKKFLWKNIICRFGLPQILISNNGRQFAEDYVKSWCTDLHTKQRFISVAHPQANGQVELANRIIKDGLRKRLDKAGTNWVDELPSVLWAYRTMPSSSTKETLFSLVYGTEALIPAEISSTLARVDHYSTQANDQELRLNLDELEEKRDQAHICMAQYKNLISQYYNSWVRPRSYRVGDLVMRNNEVSHVMPTGAFNPKREDPYRIAEVYSAGTYKLQTLEGRILPRTWHSSHLRLLHQ